MSLAPAPSTEFTPAELAHYQSLSALYASLNNTSRAPGTSDELSAILLPQISTVWQEMTTMNQIAYGRDTFDLKAEAEELNPAIASLKQLKAQLEGYASKTEAVYEVLTQLDRALSTAEALGLNV